MRLLNIITNLFKPGCADFAEFQPQPQSVPRNTNPEHLHVNGAWIDKRHIANVDVKHYYAPDEAAQLLGCHRNTIYKLCADITPGEIDTRHFIGIDADRKYTYRHVAAHFNVSDSLIRSMARSGDLERSPIGNTFRIPGWSLCDLIKNNAASLPGISHLDYLQISTLIRIPGWALKDHLLVGCTRL